MVWPLPENMIRSFAEQVDELFVVEELDPFLELHIKAMGIRCHGKDLIPAEGELNAGIVKKAITGEDRRTCGTIEGSQLASGASVRCES